MQAFPRQLNAFRLKASLFIGGGFGVALGPFMKSREGRFTGSFLPKHIGRLGQFQRGFGFGGERTSRRPTCSRRRGLRSSDGGKGFGCGQGRILFRAPEESQESENETQGNCNKCFHRLRGVNSAENSPAL